MERRRLPDDFGQPARPRELVTQQTLKWLAGLPKGAGRLLEIGCGHGDLAVRLQRLGLQVTALDSDEKSVQEARRKGVRVQLASWPEFEDAPFDIVLFTRSLHHMRRLAPALEKARQLLKPSGLLLVEDFAREAVGKAAAGWFQRLVRELDRTGVLESGKTDLLERMLACSDALEVWREKHPKHLFDGQKMIQAVESQFAGVRVEKVPYLFRYFASALPENERGVRTLKWVIEEELKSAVAPEIELIGRRILAAGSATGESV